MISVKLGCTQNLRLECKDLIPIRSTDSVDVIRAGQREGGAHVGTGLGRVGHELATGQQDDVLGQRPFHDHGPRVGHVQATDPQEHAGGRHVPLGQAGQVRFGRAQHGVTLLPVEAAHPVHVLLEAVDGSPLLQQLRHHHLRQRRRVQHRHLCITDSPRP